jgi:CRP-like cAMP-binding protein
MAIRGAGLSEDGHIWQHGSSNCQHWRLSNAPPTGGEAIPIAEGEPMSEPGHSPPSTPDVPRGNRLLDALPLEERARLLPSLTPVWLARGQRLHGVHEPITHVYFPLTALVSLLVVLEDGRQIEVAAIGYEGVVGLSLAMGAMADMHLALVQVPGEALMLTTEAFLAVLPNLPALHLLLTRYALVRFAQVAQSAACSAFHSLGERCARWLLETYDRVGRNEFSLTQDFLAAMLGVHRPTVTVALGMLQQAGLISTARGRIRILNPGGLVAAACECYRVVAAEAERLLGPVRGQS